MAFSLALGPRTHKQAMNPNYIPFVLGDVKGRHTFLLAEVHTSDCFDQTPCTTDWLDQFCVSCVGLRLFGKLSFLIRSCLPWLFV